MAALFVWYSNQFKLITLSITLFLSHEKILRLLAKKTAVQTENYSQIHVNMFITTILKWLCLDWFNAWLTNRTTVLMKQLNAMHLTYVTKVFKTKSLQYRDISWHAALTYQWPSILLLMSRLNWISVMNHRSYEQLFACVVQYQIV